MTRRLESLDCLQKGTWEGLSAQGYESSRMRSHLELSATQKHRQRLPERFVRLAVQAFEEEKIGESELMRLLRCSSRVEAREIVDWLTRPTEVGVSGKTYQLDLDFGDSLGLAQAEKRA